MWVIAMVSRTTLSRERLKRLEIHEFDNTGNKQIWVTTANGVAPITVSDDEAERVKEFLGVQE